MSHEFRTPLGAIRSIARILLDQLDGPLSAEQKKQVAFIQSSAVELTEMVNDLLDLAKIEAGRVSISREWFAMVDLFAALRGMFKPILSDSISLIFEEPDDLPRIYTDHKKLSQILRNYISNALKFTLDGEVRVTASATTTNTSRFPSPTRESALPWKTSPPSFRTSCRSIRRCKRNGAARALGWR